MHICVLNGSPKGEYSITLQTVLYLQKRFADCTFSVVHVGKRIKAYEKDLRAAVAEMEAADLLLFAYPVYTFLAPYQLHRFVELLHGCGANISGKYAAQITTSKHFYDVTAHRYIEQNCADLGLKYIGGLSADMDDLLTARGRADTEAFWKYVLFCAENGIVKPIQAAPSEAAVPYAATPETVPKRAGFDVAVVTNCVPEDQSLAAMTADFRAAFPYETRVINIAEYPFAGGCLGCFACAGDGTCVYKDGFDTFLRERVQNADAVVYAFTVKDHSMGASFKLFDDRQFCNGHRTVTMGKPVGYIVNGNYAGEANLQRVVEARSQVGGNFLAGVATDADGLRSLAAALAYALEQRLTQPSNFYGVGGMKIFRDLIYVMRGLMKADHRFYKAHGMYDFPQKRVGMILKMQLVGALFTNPKLRAKAGGRMNEGMIAPYRDVLKSVDEEA